ncbi:MAG: hypothetical protein JST75_20840 [Bacteroidetes bacterium]|nr:hypothetical protein [Bacteroidota bacterium]
MSKKDHNIIKLALKYINSFFEMYGDKFVFHSYNFITENVDATKEIAKAEGLDKDEYEMGLLAIVFKDVGIVDSKDETLDNQKLINGFIAENQLSQEEQDELKFYIDFLRSNRFPKTLVEQVLRDGADIHLSLPDAMEGLNLLKIEREGIFKKIYSDEDWYEVNNRYFVTHKLYTTYAKRQYGVQRSKNYFEIQRRLEKFKSERTKQRRGNDRHVISNALSDKETEDLFKIAFRNYVDLVSVADRKAGLLIQVNSILLSVIIAFTIRHVEATPLYMIPTGIILITAVITIFTAILASKPQQRAFTSADFDNSQSFFFGSFDRIDPEFKNTTWKEYWSSMVNLFSGDKREIFNQITRETFQVRKVLSMKFGYLAIAYKIFISGIGIAIVSFIIVALIRS